MFKYMLHTFLIVFFLLVSCSPLPVSKTSEKELNLKEKNNIPVMYVKETMKMVGLGDSLTAGFGDETKNNGYVGRVKDYLEESKYINEVIVENFGVKGYKTTNVIKKLKEDEELRNKIEEADIIVMTIGANDLMAVVKDNIFSLTYEPFRQEKERYQDRILEILTLIRELNPQASLYFVGLYNPFKSAFPDFPEVDMIIEEWNNVSKKILARDEKATFVSIFDVFSNHENENLLYKDEFHPSDVGYTYIAERVYRAIEQDRKM